MADSHAVVRKNTERSCEPFTRFLPGVTSCKIIAQFHNQGIDVNPVNISSWVLFRTLKFEMSISHPCRDESATRILFPQRSLMFHFYSHIVLSCPALSLTPDNHKSVLHSYNFIVSKMLHAWNYTACNFSGLAFFTRNNFLEIHPDCYMYQ